MKKSLLFFLFTLAVYASAVHAKQPTNTLFDSTTVVFSFHASNDAFYIPYKENDSKLEQLLKIIEQNKATILDGQMPIYIAGHSTTLATDAQNLTLAKIRANRVKSELITRQQLNESHFRDKKQITYNNILFSTRIYSSILEESH